MDNNATHNIDDLLVKCLLQEADTNEQQQVTAWLQQHEGNRRYFNQFLLIWNESRKLASISTVDENKAWQHFKQKIEKPAGAKVVAMKTRRTWTKLAAAGLIAVAAVAIVYWLVNNNRGGEMAVIKSGTTVLTDSLADGSVVTLNKNSSIVYEKNLRGTTRNIRLSGEAFFDVAPDKNKPFVITVNDVIIKVVGTSFNVKNNNGNTEVIVESGVVEVMHKSKTTMVKAKEKVIVAKDREQMQRDSSHGKLYNYYRTKTFVCDNTPLWQLVETLNEAYGSNIVIENKSISGLPLTVTFNEEPIDNILSIITETLDITAGKKGNQIVLR